MGWPTDPTFGKKPAAPAPKPVGKPKKEVKKVAPPSTKTPAHASKIRVAY